MTILSKYLFSAVASGGSVTIPYPAGLSVDSADAAASKACLWSAEAALPEGSYSLAFSGSSVTVTNKKDAWPADSTLFVSVPETTGADKQPLYATSSSGGVEILDGVIAPAPTGNVEVDTAALAAAWISAYGKTLAFRPGYTYTVRGYWTGLAAGVGPVRVIGNGATLKLPALVSTLTTATIAANATSVQVSEPEKFKVGDRVAIIATDYSISSREEEISAINGNTLTLSPVSWAVGSGTAPIGCYVVRSDTCLFVNGIDNIEISGLVFDGTEAARSIRTWTHSPLINCNACDNLNLHGNVFKNSACDAVWVDASGQVKITKNHFENIFGNGAHVGGSQTLTLDYICANNSFKNVFLANASTTPTASQYSHASGPIASSDGPKRAIIIGNTIDGSEAVGISGQGASYNTEYIITANTIKDCKSGAWRMVSLSSNGIMTNNIVINCGIQSGYGAETPSITRIRNVSRFLCEGNQFIDSCLIVTGLNAEGTVRGNTFTCLNKSYNAVEQASLILDATSRVLVSGNVFRGPKTAAEYTAAAVNSAPLRGIHFGSSGNPVNNVTVSDNMFVGYERPIYIETSDNSANKIRGNTFVDQYSATEASCISTAVLTATSLFDVSDNTFTFASSNATPVWSAIKIDSTGTAENRIADNIIRSYHATVGKGVVLIKNGVWRVESNVIKTPEEPILAASASATTHILLNRLLGGTKSVASATVSIGGGTDSNFTA